MLWRAWFGVLLIACVACAARSSPPVPSTISARTPLTVTSYSSTVLAYAPTQYFQLNESSGPIAYDDSPSKINGSYVGAVTFGLAGPLLSASSKAIALPGGSASVGVKLPGPGVPGSVSYSIQTWVLPLPAANPMTVWGASGSHRLLLTPQGSLLSQFAGNFTSKSVLTMNRWHDVVFVYNANTLTQTYYIDGKQDASAGLSRDAAVFTTPYYLGQYDTGSYYKWHGDLAQHAFYPTALTSAQIAHLHAEAGYPAPSPTSNPTPAPTPTLSGVTIPHFSSSFTYGGATFHYRMVGSNPITAPVSTTIGVEIVPVSLTFSNGIVLDPTTAAATIPNTPLFVNGSYAAGNTQYGDAFMRSQFWHYVANTAYHVLLGKPKLEATVRVLVPASDGYTSTSNGQTTGYATYAWFVQTIEPQILRQLAIDPRTLAIIATSSFKVLQPGGACCYAGYHSAFQTNTSLGASVSTTAWASVTANGVETLSHEIGEWLADPFYTNVVPGWLNPKSLGCNGDLLEVGDPVTFFTFTINGVAMQDLAFYSWFSRKTPSVGINGRYDFTGSLTSPATSC